MTTNFKQHGAVLDFVPSADTVSGEVVVMGHTLGIALTDIASGALGAVAVEGVYELPKVSTAVFSIGEKLLYDDSATAFDDSSAVAAPGDLLGAAIAMQAGQDGQTTCLAKLTPGNADLN